MNRYLVSVITPNYVLKAAPYLESMHLFIESSKVVLKMEPPEPKSSVEARLWYAIDNWANSDSNWEKIDYIRYQRPATHSHNMVQWGVFLDALPFAQPDDLICLTDTDLVVQRGLTATEWSQIEAACAEGNFCASWNCGPTDNLYAESLRLRLNPEWVGREFDQQGAETNGNPDTWLCSIPCFNCGVLFATVATFRQLQAAYESRCEEFYKATAHRSRCQFLMNYCLWVEGIGVAELPAAVHVHGHWSDGKSVLLPEGSHWRNGELWVGEEKVVFRHNLEAPQ